MRSVTTKILSWELSEPFTISRGTITHCDSTYVEIRDEHGNIGRGEAVGIDYEGETPASILDQVEAIRKDLEQGATRHDLQSLLPFGGARNLIDAALWDLDAKQTNVPVWKQVDLPDFRAVVCAQTIGIRTLDAYRERAQLLSHFPLLKIKVDGSNDMAILEAIHNAAPNAKLIVDPNQSWTLDHLKAYNHTLPDLGIALLEQPLPVDGDDGLIGFSCTVPICADESVHDRNDLDKLRNKYDAINIKLDKTGGLTEALALAQAATAKGYKLMVGCMAGSSLAMAPSAIIAQYCDFVDLDGPLLQKDDVDHPIVYKDGIMNPPSAKLWG